MTIAPKSAEEAVSPALRTYAQLHGLDRALALFPEAVAAAHARGSRPIGALPDHVATTTEPALWFVAGFDP